MKPKLESIEWFRMSRSFRSPEEVANIWSEVEQVATQMMRPQPYTRNLTFIGCRGCSYNELCLEELRGRDVEFIRTNRYRSLDTNQLENPELVPPVEEWIPPEITE